MVLLTMLGVALPIGSPLGPVLPTLWQVQAGVLGLAVAVSVFAFQSLGTLRGSRRRVITLTGFPASLLLGTSLTILIGAAVLTAALPWGGWLGAGAVVLTGGWLIMLVLAFAEAPRIQDPQYGLELRIGTLRRGVSAAVKGLLVRRVSARVLEAEVEAAGGRLDLLASGSPPANAVQSPLDGNILDVWIPDLRAAVQRSAARENPLRIHMRLGDRVSRESQLCSADYAIDADVRLLIQRCVEVRRVHEPSLVADLEDLHDEAKASIEAGGSQVLEQVLDVYRSILEDYAEAWRAFAPQLEPAHLPDWWDQSEAPVAAIQTAVRSLFERSLSALNRDAAFALVYFPVAVAVRSTVWAAPAYLQMLQLYPFFYAIASRQTVDTDMRRIFSERAWWHPMEALELMLPATERNLEDELRPLADATRKELHRTIFQVLRLTVRNNDIGNFREALRRWRLADR